MRLTSTIRRVQLVLRPRCVRGLTLIELLIVISIIVILSGLSLAVFKRTQEKANDQMTHSLLNTIISAASQYNLGLSEWPHTGRGIARPFMWDTNGDGLLDAQSDPSLPADYSGFLTMAANGVAPKWAVVNGTLCDRWKQRIRVAAPVRYGSISSAPSVVRPKYCIIPDHEHFPFGVFSIGRNGIDETATSLTPTDDLRTW